MDKVLDYKPEESKEKPDLGNKFAPKRQYGNNPKGQMEDIKEQDTESEAQAKEQPQSKPTPAVPAQSIDDGKTVARQLTEAQNLKYNL